MKYLYLFETNDYHSEIIYKNKIMNYDNKIFMEYNNINLETKQLGEVNKDLKYLNKKSRFISFDSIGYNYILENYGFTNNTMLYITDINKLTNIKIDNNNNKVKNIILKFEPFFYKSKIKLNSLNNVELIEQKSFIIMLYNLFDILEIGGNINFNISNYYNYKTFDILYLILNFFEKIIVIKGKNIFCLNYKLSKINKNDIKKIFDNNLLFSIKNKFDIEHFINYLNDNFKIRIERKKILFEKNEHKYLIFINKYINDILNELGDIDYIKQQLKLDIIHHFKKKINKDKIINTNSGVKYEEGNFLKNMIDKYKFKNCLEVGFANGISATYMLMNNDINLISIDPFQKSQWKNEGVKLLKEFNLDKRHKLILKKSYEALPLLLTKYKESYFDFIFIDGWHTFDYTLVDFFYSNLLLKIGGIIIIDDALHNGVSKCVKYLETNYKFYVKLNGPATIAIFKKIKDDNREWNFHNFF